VRSINFCLDSSHEIDQFLSWFFTWDRSISVLILHMRSINLPQFFTPDQSSSALILHMRSINVSWFFIWDWSIHLSSSLTVYCASLNTHPFREPASTLLRMTHIAHLEYNIMSFQIVTLNFSHCELHPTPPPQPNPSPQISSSFPILHQICYFSSSLTGWKSFVLASICPLCWDSQPPGGAQHSQNGLARGDINPA
jgi:hypothetical protein